MEILHIFWSFPFTGTCSRKSGRKMIRHASVLTINRIYHESVYVGLIESIIAVRWRQKNFNLRNPPFQWETRLCRVAHWNGGPKYWGFPVPLKDNDEFFSSHIQFDYITGFKLYFSILVCPTTLVQFVHLRPNIP